MGVVHTPYTLGVLLRYLLGVLSGDVFSTP